MAQYRCCARCRKELTDPASRDNGVGPVCRKMDNAILAKLMPSQPKVAILAFGGVNPSEFPPEAMDTIVGVATALESMSEGDDMRPAVRKIEWLASFVPVHSKSRTAMHDTLVALGYVTLAALWMGDVSTGKALVSFADGRLYLQGPRNVGGREALKAIPGRMFHAAQGNEGARWSVPASQFATFRRVILTHWPLAEGLADALVCAEESIVPIATSPTALPPAPPKTPTVTITPCTNGFEIRSPYSPKFLARMKAEIPWNARQWNAVAKAWVIATAHIEKIRDILADVYGLDAIAA